MHIAGCTARALTPILAVLFLGCGEAAERQPSAACSEGDDYHAHLSKTGTNGLVIELVQSDPAPPAKGDNRWQLRVLASGAPELDATVVLTSFMPAHGHASAVDAVVTEEGNGFYSADPVNLAMPGLWEVTVAVDDGTTTDEVVFAFCIEG
jgi:hypothetical protein